MNNNRNLEPMDTLFSTVYKPDGSDVQIRVTYIEDIFSRTYHFRFDGLIDDGEAYGVPIMDYPHKIEKKETIEKIAKLIFDKYLENLEELKKRRSKILESNPNYSCKASLEANAFSRSVRLLIWDSDTGEYTLFE